MSVSRRLLPWVVLLFAAGSSRLCAQQAGPLTPTPLDWRKGPVDLRGPARPDSYIGIMGRRAAAMGTEQGGFEVWTWPLKLLHDFRLSFQTPLYADPIPAADVARRVEVTPAGTTIIYSHPAFTVRERIFSPDSEPAVVVVLEVDAVRPMEILAEFQSDLQFAWPASLGGQFVYWDDTDKAFVLSESRRQVNGYVGSPYTTSATNQPAHNVPEAPNQLRIAVGDQAPVPMPRPGEPAGRLTQVHATGIPIVMVGAAAPRDSVRAIYRRVLASVPRLYAGRAAHAGAVLDSALWTETPDSMFDLAVRWAALNLDEALVCNPDLGCGPVAGYGPSGSRGTRPGFAWFFGGDAAINSLGMTAAGAFGLARRSLEFFAKYQREDGKIPHEISQGAGRIRWFEDYPYAFYHADTTPYWLLAWGDYWLASGDTATIRRLWPSLRRAYAWSRSTIDTSTGLMLNSRGGLGAIEVGDLGVGVQSDIYLSGVWVQALDRVARMAAALGDSAAASGAAALRRRALVSLRDRFWLPRDHLYAFALLDGGQIRPELTVWPSIALAFGLLDSTRGAQESAALARATIETDWGARALAGTSKLFDPLHYNNGTVWPFVTGFQALAQYRSRNPVAGFAALDAIVRTGFTWGLGRNPEVFSGSRYEPMDTAVPQQFFGTSFILTVTSRGLLGWWPDVPGDSVRLEPQLPAGWPGAVFHKVPAGESRYRIALSQTATAFRATIHADGPAPSTLIFAPHLPLGASVGKVTANGTDIKCQVIVSQRDTQPVCRLSGERDLEVVVNHTPGFQVELPEIPVRRGDPSRNLRLVDQRLAGDTLVLSLEGPAGTEQQITVLHGEKRTIPVRFARPGDPVDGYAGAEVRVAP